MHLDYAMIVIEIQTQDLLITRQSTTAVPSTYVVGKKAKISDRHGKNFNYF